MKRRSWSGDICLTDMYPPYSMLGPKMVNIGIFVIDQFIHNLTT
jgi:hypothetical protein